LIALTVLSVNLGETCPPFIIKSFWKISSTVPCRGRAMTRQAAPSA
jgi:hypothetical protein